MKIEKTWSWFAGKQEDDYSLAGPCETKEMAIAEAYGDVLPGDRIYLIEALVISQDETEDGGVTIEESRNAHSIIRLEDEAQEPVEDHIEQMAQAIFEAMDAPQNETWVPGGTSARQMAARKSAKASWTFWSTIHGNVTNANQIVSKTLEFVSKELPGLLVKNLEQGTYHFDRKDGHITIDGGINVDALKNEVLALADKI